MQSRQYVAKFAKVFLASKQPVKIEAAKTFFKEVVPCDAKSMVSEQPFGTDEILQGARNRLNSVNAIPAVSFETGIEKHGEEYFDVTHCILRTPLGYFYGSAKYHINKTLTEREQLDKWLELPDRRQVTLGSLIAKSVGSPSCTANDWYCGVSRKEIMAKALHRALFEFQNWRNALCTTRLNADLKKHEKIKNIDFIDIQTCLTNPSDKILTVTEQLTHGLLFNVVVCVEARGLLFAEAFKSKGFSIVMARKPGKLPGEELKSEYEKEYGTDTICIQKGTINKGDKVLIVDDVIATGGTMMAVAKLVEMCGAEVVGFVAPFMVVKSKVESKQSEELPVPGDLSEGPNVKPVPGDLSEGPNVKPVPGDLSEGPKLLCPPTIGQNCRFLQTQESLGVANNSADSLNAIDNLMQMTCIAASQSLNPMPLDTYCIFPKDFEYYGQTAGINWGRFYQSSNIWFRSDVLRNKNVLVFVDLTNPISTFDILQLLAIINKKEPKSVRVIFPFIEQSTQDRIEYMQVDINGANVVLESLAEIDTIARLFENHKAITFDLHALQSQLVFKDLTCYSLMTHLWYKYKNQYPDAIPVFPDEGAKKRFSNLLNIKNAVCFLKDRGASGTERKLKLDVPIDPKTAGGRFVIIDDLVRSGGTMSEAVKYLRSIGATKVDVMFSHAPFQADTARKFVGFDSVWTSDSCPRRLPREWVKVRVMEVLAEIQFA